MSKSMLLNYAMQFVGKFYLWGGEGPSGFDCSGLTQELLRSVGADPPGDQTAQTLYDYFKHVGIMDKRECGSLVFYGKDLKSITHVAMMLNDWQVIEAGGGGSKNKTIEDADKNHAMVRIRPFNQRKDMVAIIAPRVV